MAASLAPRLFSIGGRRVAGDLDVTVKVSCAHTRPLQKLATRPNTYGAEIAKGFGR